MISNNDTMIYTVLPSNITPSIKTQKRKRSI